MRFSSIGKANGAPARPGSVGGEQMAQTQTHVPPQNLEAEASVLGAMMVSEGAIAPVILDVRLHDEDRPEPRDGDTERQKQGDVHHHPLERHSLRPRP
jgi:hypothetical protein